MTVLISQTGSTIDVPDAVAADYLAQGYTEPGTQMDAATDSADETPRNSWTVQQLDDWADAHGVELDPGMKRGAKLAELRRHLDS